MSATPDTAWPGHERGTAGYRRMQWALFAAGMACFAQLYSPQGVLPLLAADLGVTASQASLAVSAATGGLALSVLPWSLVADRIGRLTAIRIALVGGTGLGLLVPWCPWFELMLVLRVLEGAALGGVAALAVAYLSEEVSPRAAAVAAGTYVAGTSLGGLMGRIVAAPVGDLAGWRTGVSAVAALAAVAVVAFWVLPPEPRGFRAQRSSVGSVARTCREHLRRPGLMALYMQAFLLMGGFVAVYNYLGFRLEGPPWNLSVGAVSLLFLAYLSGTGSARVAGSLADRWGQLPVLLASVGLMVTGVLVTLSSMLPVVIVGLVVFTTGFFGAHSVASGWAGAAAEHGRSQSTSLYTLAYYAGSSVVGYAGGFAWGGVGWGGLVAVVAGLALAAGAWAVLALRGR
ncbi:Predicted arabinose efflux permease, MFS family [Kytococcus aerolatus]|uniref:Predicted arabinose efflux permease, MFS family n=1 Tax=Kytococcus aerolatus TaxID=592308 RepID=A0A212TBG9_9MICO|nr:MFS transporter [Kytococcus aerolatus]SNC63397.1 Predicted arabinose efflux permease, MFS family [Kytococcus aerolatus]